MICTSGYPSPMNSGLLKILTHHLFSIVFTYSKFSNVTCLHMFHLSGSWIATCFYVFTYSGRWFFAYFLCPLAHDSERLHSFTSAYWRFYTIPVRIFYFSCPGCVTFFPPKKKTTLFRRFDLQEMETTATATSFTSNGEYSIRVVMLPWLNLIVHVGSQPKHHSAFVLLLLHARLLPMIKPLESTYLVENFRTW